MFMQVRAVPFKKCWGPQNNAEFGGEVDGISEFGGGGFWVFIIRGRGRSRTKNGKQMSSESGVVGNKDIKRGRESKFPPVPPPLSKWNSEPSHCLCTQDAYLLIMETNLITTEPR